MYYLFQGGYIFGLVYLDPDVDLGAFQRTSCKTLQDIAHYFLENLNYWNDQNWALIYCITTVFLKTIQIQMQIKNSKYFLFSK